jgi:hypothetical protein
MDVAACRHNRLPTLSIVHRPPVTGGGLLVQERRQHEWCRAGEE